MPGVRVARGDARRGADATSSSICTPSGLHPQHGIIAAQRREARLTEKPMAISLAAADELVQACDEAGVQLFVVKQNRLNPPIQLLKRAIDKGRFGRIYMANSRCAGRGRRSTTTRSRGAARGSSTAARS